ncbi:MAG TPA: M50 family metallopeptidase [Streptosporangiaceae bacterium]|jgi:hypothetical protein|nr:M50 family metallopeptidase [Streptosporangiaceae bacterium]
MTALAHFWDRITATGPVLATWLVALTAAIAFVVVASHRVWHVSRNVVTLAHEGGHAVVSIASGRRLDGIRLHSDTSGVTSSRGKNHGPGLILTTAAGYVTPSLLGVGAACLVAVHHSTFLLWLVLFLLAATFVAIRNAYGFLSVLAVAVLVFLISRFASLRAQEVFAYLAAWFLLFGGIRPVFELQRRRRRGGALSSDADQLALLTGIPGGAWIFLFGLVAIASLVAGAYLLLPGVSHWLLSSTS